LEKHHPEFQTLKKEYRKAQLAKNNIMNFYDILVARSFQSSDLVTHIMRRLYDNDTLLRRKSHYMLVNSRYEKTVPEKHRLS
jgi:hypothetical protein